MSAELLRRAAAELRARAGAVRPGDWTTIEGAATGSAWINVGMTAHAWGMHGYPAEANYVAMMHPPVALAIADVLDGTADEFEGVPSPELAGRMYAADIVLARAILREDAP